jgi:hypothetical protein
VQAGQAVVQRLQPDAGDQPGERRAHAHVPAAAEREVLLRVLGSNVVNAP